MKIIMLDYQCTNLLDGKTKPAHSLGDLLEGIRRKRLLCCALIQVQSEFRSLSTNSEYWSEVRHDGELCGSRHMDKCFKSGSRPGSTIAQSMI
jgi:hypothetical protein